MLRNRHNSNTRMKTQSLIKGLTVLTDKYAVTNDPPVIDIAWSIRNKKILTIPPKTFLFSLTYTLTCAIYMILWVVLGVLVNFLQNI